MPRPVRIALILGCLALVALACSRTSEGPATGQRSVSYQNPEASEVGTWPAPTRGATILESLTVDLDSDGASEQVTASLSDNGALTLRIAQQDSSGGFWQHTFDEHLEFRGLQALDLNADGVLEVLLSTMGPEKESHGLIVIRWTQEEAHLLSPKGGPSAGSMFFASQYYPPLIEDLDGDSLREIVLVVDGGDSRFLPSAVYEWDGAAYRQVSFLLVPPRPRPSIAAPQGSP